MRAKEIEAELAHRACHVAEQFAFPRTRELLCQVRQEDEEATGYLAALCKRETLDTVY